MSDGVKKVLIIAGVIFAAVAVIFVYQYNGTCEDGLFRTFHSYCYGPK